MGIRGVEHTEEKNLWKFVKIISCFPGIYSDFWILQRYWQIFAPLHAQEEILL